MNWYYVENGQQRGPLTEAQLDDLAKAGTIKSDTLVWAEGMANWLPYSQARGGAASAPPLLAPPGAAPFGAAPFATGPDQVRQKVSGPAVGLIVTGGFGIIGGILGLLTPLWMSAMVQWLENAQPGNPGLEQMKAMATASTISQILFGVINLAVAGLTIFAAMRMKNLRSHTLAVVMSIISMLPYLSGCCCVGLPVGIWALVVLFKPEVKSAFDR
jgi:hypothetical protein